MSYVLNMISYVISSYDFTCTFHMNINKSCMFHTESYLSDGYEILCDFTCFLAPARAGSKGSRSCSNAPWFESNEAAPRPVRLSVFFGLGIELQWFTNPYKASRPPVPPPSRPSPGASSPGGARLSFFGAAAYHFTSLRLRNAVKSVSDTKKIQILENGVGLCLTSISAMSTGKGHLWICRQMHMEHRRGAGRPYLTAP